MNVDKFGHHVLKKQKMNNYKEPSLAFINVTDCFDAKNKTIKHIGKPVDPEDCATKQYVDNTADIMLNKIKSIHQELTQLETEINSLQQSIESVSFKNKYMK